MTRPLNACINCQAAVPGPRVKGMSVLCDLCRGSEPTGADMDDVLDSFDAVMADMGIDDDGDES